MMFRGAVPFILLQIATLAVAAAYPLLVIWLPAQVLGFN